MHYLLPVLLLLFFFPAALSAHSGLRNPISSRDRPAGRDEILERGLKVLKQ
jgi:hypothetical protein